MMRTVDAEVLQPVTDDSAYDSAAGTLSGVASPIAVEYVRLLLSQRAFLQKAIYVGFLLAVMFAFALPAKYESFVRLMPPENQSTDGVAALASLAAKGGGGTGIEQIAGDLIGGKKSSSLLIGVLQSKHVQNRLVADFDLRRVYWTRSWENARRELSSNTAISEDRKSAIITIAVTDHNPRRAAEMARRYVAELNRTMAELNTSGANRERLFLEGRLKLVKEELDSASRELSAFSTKNTTLDIKEQGRVMIDAAAKLQAELISEQSMLSGLEQIYTPNSPRVRQVKGRIDEMQAQISKLAGSPNGAAVKGQDLQYPSIRQLPALGVDYADLYRRVEIQQTVYKLLTERYELAKVQEAKELPTVRILDDAEVPERKSSPPRMLIVLFGPLLALCAASLWVLVARAWPDVPSTHPFKAIVAEITPLGRTQILHLAGVFRNSRNGGR